MKPFRSFQIQAVLFDFDGTLTDPGALDWAALKARLGCPLDQPVLEFMEGLPEERLRREAEAALDEFEAQGAAASQPANGAEKVVRKLRQMGLKLGILTRNSRAAVERSLKNFTSLTSGDFDLIVTRETPVPIKPSPRGVELFAETIRVPVSDVLVVGDFRLDIEAGAAAGAMTVLLDHGLSESAFTVMPDYRIERLGRLIDIVRMGIPIRGGKLPNDLLETFLADLAVEDPSVLIAPGIGQDTAAVDIENENVLILKSDPITFVTDAISEYAILVNANDIVTSGAQPRWFLTTLLFPPDTTPGRIGQVMMEIQRVCRKWGITLCGGHTEVTDAVTRPVVTGMLIGTVDRDRLIDKQRMRPGDAVILTKGVAVEGTAIIAGEFSEKLQSLGMPGDAIRGAATFLDRIGVIEEARIAADHPGTSAIHDVTEGGLATALDEFSIAGGHRMRIHMDRIPIFPETETICRLLDIHPLGLIGSGSLIICCRSAVAQNLCEQIRGSGIETVIIGEVIEAGRGIEALDRGRPTPWPVFDADELTRLF